MLYTAAFLHLLVVLHFVAAKDGHAIFALAGVQSRRWAKVMDQGITVVGNVALGVFSLFG